LKTVGINPRKAMQQIVDYKNEPGTGYGNTLMCFMQLFIVSNYSDTWYFANNNSRHFNFGADERFLPLYRFASEDNVKITRLDIFAEKFLAKCFLGEMISRYTVLVTSEQKLLIMRPYQIYAVKAIVDCIKQNCGNGYIWHTTGSGKTLTSFKASTLLKDNPDIEKCLFVVDRKDLDKQTREEFNRFQEGCVEENTSTEGLVKRLESTDYANKVIVATIQKLGLALDGNSKHDYKKRMEPLRKKRMVFIFDECHRSQFGENHAAIKDFFPNAQLFGFTGTPIFPENAVQYQVKGQEAQKLTTKDVFQKELHSYTITHAIEDENVLRFRIDYYKPDSEKKIKPGEAQTKEAVVKAILGKHDAATADRKFNAILATNSINDAIEYFGIFKSIQAQATGVKPLNVACVFSPPAEGDKDIQQIQEDLPQEKADNAEAPDEKKAALKAIISDYNAVFETNYNIGEFDRYYQDVQQRIKKQEYPNQDFPQAKKIDVVIVVDMLLTGFDSKYLNTLYVDKKLKHHGLIQAFSRTNRVLNSTKPHGSIIDFRQHEDAVNEAIAMFSGEKVNRPSEIWLVDPAPVIISKLQAAVGSLEQFMQSQGLALAPDQVPNLKGDAARGQFINLFKEVQRFSTQLDRYTGLEQENIEAIKQIISIEQLAGFRCAYLDAAHALKARQETGARAAPAGAQLLDFEFVLFASAIVDYDYIMAQIARLTDQTPSKEKMTREQLIGLIQGEAKLIDERDDITEYVFSLDTNKTVFEGVAEAQQAYEHFKAQKNEKELDAIATKHGLVGEQLQDFVAITLKRMVFDGDHLRELFAPLGLGWKARAEREQALVDELAPMLRRLAKGREVSGLGVYEQ
jgi:type I restriction enzyme R subunit